METDIKQLRCGECGETKHELYIRANGEIIAECCKCKSQSEIIINKPEIIIHHNAGNGTLCVF
jgi:NAD-dependent SIR2 family protein deacetylase